MVKQVINVGANANDGTGDDLRTAMQKVNSNFSELFGATAEANDLVEDISPQLGGNLDLQNYIITTSATNGAISLQPNGTGSVLLKNIRITDNVISSDDSTSITVNESLVVTGSVSTPTLYTNVIQSEDSSVVQINDGLQVTGVMKSNSVITNTLSSDDSSAIEVIDDLLISGTVSTNSVRTNSLYSEAIQIVDNNISTRRSNDDLVLSPSGTGSVNLRGAKIINVATPVLSGDATTKAYVDSKFAGGLNGVTFTGDDSTGVTTTAGDQLHIKGASGITTAVSGVSPFVLTITGPNLSSYLTSVPKTINVNEISSSDSTAIQINDGLNVSGTFTANTIQTNNISSSESTTIQVDDGMSVQGTLTANTFVTNNISSSESSAIQINDSINISGNATIAGTINGSLAFSNLTSKPTTLSGYGITDAVSTLNTAITLVGDDSTGTAVTVGETFKIAGTSNISTAVSGDTLTITGPSLDNIITVVGDDSTGTSFNKGETIKIAGSGGITTSVSGDTLTIAATLTGGTLANLSVTGQTISGTTTNGNINITPNGTGDINLTVGGQVKITDGTNDYSGVIGVANSLARYNYGISSFSYNDFNLSAFDRHRVYANSLAGHISLLGTDPVNAQIAWRGLQVDLFTDAEGKSLSSRGSAVADPSSKTSLNSGGEISTYSLGPVALGVTNQLRNTNASPSYLPEGLGIFSFAEFVNDFDTYGNGSITFEDYNNFNAATNLASASGTATITNLVGYRAGGNYFTDGTGNVTNYYAFYANGISEGTNNYGIYVESEDWENYLGGLVIKNSTIAANRTNENLYLRTAGTGKVIVDDSLQVVNTLTANTFVTNDISSADSSAIQINDSVNISGTLSVDTIDTNVISSGDSSAIQINDSVNISGTLNSATIVNNTISTNEIASADSSAIQINDGVNISGTLNAKTIVTNDLISQDSSVINVLDGLNVSGALTAATVSTTNINSSSTVSAEHLTLTGLLTLGKRTVAQLILLTPDTGTMAYCTDETGGAQPVFYDGTNWRRMTDRIIIS